MSGTALWARLRALGPAAKVAVATTAAVLTMSTAVAAAVVLPSGRGDSHSAAIQTSTAVQAGLFADPATPMPSSAETSMQAGGGVSLPTSPGSTSVSTDARAGAGATVAAPTTPVPSIPLPTLPTSVPALGGVVPDVSGLTDIPTKVMACLEPIFDLVSTVPSMPSMQQIMGIGPTIASCVSAIVADLPLPFGLNSCISAIMGFVSTMTSQLPTGFPGIGNLNVAACIPSGLPVPTGFAGFMGGGFPFRS